MWGAGQVGAAVGEVPHWRGVRCSTRLSVHSGSRASKARAPKPAPVGNAAAHECGDPGLKEYQLHRLLPGQ